MLAPKDPIIHGESVYMFPNGDSWKQRRNLGWFFIQFRYNHDYASQCCSFVYDETREVNIDGALKYENVYVLMDNKYGEFLTSDNGQIDSQGNKLPRTATVDFDKWGEIGEYIKAEEGRSDDANGPATASFSFHFHKE
ncbi:hypothetical protein TIFTF001_039105 [Ficus carica]|uniref:Uncharacterized protein n=1 Tax=Ficus carica TaxID=3494 RepID=A0AA88E8L5_FICCA|nr:hypothetical protein TIFTF001_039105 [Ficus carica]